MMKSLFSKPSTPLHIAVSQNRIENVLILLREGADPNAQNKIGNTPLHFCARLANLEIAKALIAGKARQSIKNRKSQTPLSACNHYKNNDLKEYLTMIREKTIKKESLDAMVRRYLPWALPPEAPEEEDVVEPVITETIEPPPPKEAAPNESEEFDAAKLTELYQMMINIQRRLNTLLPDVQIEEAPPLSDCTGEEIATRLASLSELLPEGEEEDSHEGEAEWGADEDFQWGMCDICGGIASQKCRKCQRLLCDICIDSATHQEMHIQLD
jgi:hypothetical protein